MKRILNRRDFLQQTTAVIGGALAALPPASSVAGERGVQAVAFDAFALLDPRPVFTLADELFPGKGAELSNLWRTRQFEYTWLRTVAGQYADFWRVTEDALRFAARALKLDLDSPKRARLMNAYLELSTWPDVPSALRSLKAAGMRLAFLSNLPKRVLEACTENSGLKDLFEHFLSTDVVKHFKPAPQAYQMAVNAFGLKREAILFAAFAGWDAAGAKWFGFPTVWVNRLNSPMEELSVLPDAACHDLSDLAAFVSLHR